MNKLEQMLKTLFVSLKPLRLRQLPAKHSKQRIVLDYVIAEFDEHQEYSEAQVNEILSQIYDDYATLRRMLIDNRYMVRLSDGSLYQRRVSDE